MNEIKNFDYKVKLVIEELIDKIEQQDVNFEVELEYASEVLTIDVDGRIFVVNKHAPLQEIWLASPISGPYHFKEINDTWKDSKGNLLKNVLSEELSELLEKDIIL